MIKVKRRRRQELSPDITPLIDVVFILLIFFMLTAVVAPQGMAVSLPEAKTASEQDETPTIISITKENQIFFNGEVSSLQQIKAHLLEGKPDATVVVQGDKEIAYGLFVEVMDVIRESGSHKIVLAAEVKK